jgi:NAD dependent epimerase/dehydratase family enzyme
VVLSRSGGALGRLLPLLRAGLGGPLGNGRQYWPWITLPDISSAFSFLLTSALSGPVNVSAPQAADVNTLVAELAAALHRPALLRAPAPALRLVMGKLADELLLASQRMEPVLLQGDGFSWQHPSVREAARWVVAGGS